MEKILITDDVHPLLLEEFTQAGYECDYQPDITLPSVHQVIHQYVGLIINSKILTDKTLIDKATQLRFVARLGSGREVIDISYAASKGIEAFFSPEGNSNAVGEQALGMLLALANNLVRSDNEVKQKVWQREKNRGWELRGKTIGIIGMGHTGKAFARKLAGMEMTILAYDKYQNDFEKEFPNIKKVSLEELQLHAEIISFHLPLTPETKHFCNKNFLQQCQPNVVIINTSRGNVVETKALLESLQNGKIKGACLDVFENEKVATFSIEEEEMYQELYQCTNVILSPHVAGWTQESKRLLAKVLADKILFFEQKKHLKV
jgi:D-3-phosphoglycerate dehydrogenase / 2-oxoglutarate reductase